MERREFLRAGGALALVFTGAACAVDRNAAGASAPPAAGAARSAGTSVTAAAAAAAVEASAFAAARRFADLRFGRIAYVEHGKGEAALFLHGAPLNGYQWRGAMARLAAHRRCIAPDFMGLGYSQVPGQQPLAAGDQVEMLAALMDKLGIMRADVVASDSGGAVAQLFMVRYPERVRTVMLTNCDVETNSPPAAIKPVLDMARDGTLADMTAVWLTDREKARATFGAAVFHNPASLADATIDYYVTPLVSTPLRRTQYHAFHLALTPNPLAGIEASLKRSQIPVRMVWGGSDNIFTMADARYLDGLFPRSQGIREVPDGKLFFQEEYPDIVAEEALRLWRT
ncbi:alpha/beta fold hydrolase [Pseudoduganella sp. RAF53_2]|uniref:alpha/beta fold hydrolase n=1 Tax=unclassified Pseudoduganella TaxID=2637179 RepID=UPI003F9D2CD8